MDAAELQKILSYNIKELRSLRGISQMKLAEKVFVKRDSALFERFFVSETMFTPVL